MTLICKRAIPLAFLTILACQSRPSDVPKSLPVVRATAVRESAGEPFNRYAGVVRANTQVEIDFKMGGYVKSLGRSKVAPSRALQEGDRVQAGATLALVDAADYAARVDTASAAVLEAQAAADQAHRDQLRTQALVNSGALTPVELENRSSQRDVSQARLARAEATLHEAKLALGDTRLRAPLAGVILARLVEQGAFVTARTPGFVIADDSSMKVVFGVPDSVMQTLRVGSSAQVEIPSLDRKVSATISRISPAADARSRVFEVEVMMPNQEQQLKVGLAATVILGEVDQLPKGFVVPLRALVPGAQQNSSIAVYSVVTQGNHATVHRRDLDVIKIIGDDALVLGLHPDERIVTLGASLLHDGDSVQLVP